MRVLILGGAGYIGSHTVRRLTERGHQVWIYDNLTEGHAASVPADRLIVGDLNNPAKLTETFTAHQIEAVIHFAASAYVGESVRLPIKYYRNNVVGSLTLFEQMHKVGISRIIFSSTCATYGIPERVPILESFPQQPINPYGNTKLAIERALADFCVAYGWSVGILRYFNAAGASADASIGEDHDPETHLIPLAFRTILGRHPQLDLYGTDYATPDGTCIRDYIHVEDLAEAHSLILERLKPKEVLRYNLGNGQGFSVREVLRMAQEITGEEVRVREAPRRPGDPPILLASADKAYRELGWTPKYPDLRSIMTTAWNWHRTHPDGYPE